MNGHSRGQLPRPPVARGEKLRMPSKAVEVCLPIFVARLPSRVEI